MENLGKTALQQIDGLYYLVSILDTRTIFGRDEYLISPVGGRGERWVRDYAVMIEGE